MRAVFGADPIDGEEIYVDGQQRRIHSCRQAKELRDRASHRRQEAPGLILDFDLNANISITNLPKILNGVRNQPEAGDKGIVRSWWSVSM